MKWLPRCLPATALLAIALVVTGAEASDPPGGDQIQKRVRLLEKALDHLMLDSPNFLVQRGRNAHGVYVPDHGLVLTFNAGLNADDSWVEFIDDDDDSRVIIRSGGHSRHQGGRTVLRLLGVNVDSHRHRDDGDDALDRYQEGKVELAEMFLDHAGTLSSLPTGEWIVVSGYIDDDTLRKEKKITRLVLRVRTDDLKAYADRRLSDEEARAKIEMEEF